VRILFLGINYHPEDTGIAVFTTGRCEYLAARGHEVTICTTFPYYPAWRVADSYRGALVRRERRNGVTILRTWSHVPRRVTPARRVLHEASFIASSCLRALATRPPDVVVTTSPPLGLAASTILLGRLWRVPYVFHVADLQPDAAVDLGMLPSGRLVRRLYGLERAAYRRAALVSTLTEPMRQRIVSKGVPAGKVRLFSDWADPALFDLPARGDAFRDRFLVVHAGNMGVKQGLDVVLEAARRCDHPDVLFLLVGDGAVRPRLEARGRALGLRNLRFLPLLPRDEFHDLLAATDVALVTQQRVVADIVFPSKVLAIFASGRPVVASVSAGSEVARVVREAAAGLVVPPEDPAALLQAVLALRDDAAVRRRAAERGRAFARDHWDREAILPRTEAALLDVAGAQPSAASDAATTGPREDARPAAGA
jgi:colanic acid biosynthesis glycosyl transferase WcaI